MNGRVIKIGDYFHVVVTWPDGHREHWLLTTSDLTRLRDRGNKHVLSRPRPSKWVRARFHAALFFQRFFGWFFA